MEEKTKDDYRVLAKLIGNVVIVVVVVSTVEATFPFRFCARCSLSLSPVGAGAGVGGERVLYFLPLLLKVLVASVPVVPALAPAGYPASLIPTSGYNSLGVGATILPLSSLCVVESPGRS